jgi:hypothetical protein
MESADGPIWLQDLYGKQLKWLGPVHGYAGNMIRDANFLVHSHKLGDAGWLSFTSGVGWVKNVTSHD